MEARGWLSLSVLLAILLLVLGLAYRMMSLSDRVSRIESTRCTNEDCRMLDKDLAGLTSTIAGIAFRLAQQERRQVPPPDVLRRLQQLEQFMHEHQRNQRAMEPPAHPLPN